MTGISAQLIHVDQENSKLSIQILEEGFEGLTINLNISSHFNRKNLHEGKNVEYERRSSVVEFMITKLSLNESLMLDSEAKKLMLEIKKNDQTISKVFVGLIPDKSGEGFHLAHEHLYNNGKPIDPSKKLHYRKDDKTSSIKRMLEILPKKLSSLLNSIINFFEAQEKARINIIEAQMVMQYGIKIPEDIRSKHSLESFMVDTKYYKVLSKTMYDEDHNPRGHQVSISIRHFNVFLGQEKFTGRITQYVRGFAFFTHGLDYSNLIEVKKKRDKKEEFSLEDLTIAEEIELLEVQEIYKKFEDGRKLDLEKKLFDDEYQELPEGLQIAIDAQLKYAQSVFSIYSLKSVIPLAADISLLELDDFTDESGLVLPSPHYA